MKNRAFLRASHLLTHPITLGAVGLLFINDHLLRKLWPNWWTGKLGDFAWLYFAPFAAAAILAWIIPSKWKRQEQVVALLSFVLVGGIFVLANSLSGFHRWFTNGIETLLGFPLTIHQDPTDLVAMISIGLGWRAWRLSEPSQRSYSIAGWASLLAAAFLTIANGMPAPTQLNRGIDCLRIEDEVILAHATPIHFYARHDTNFASTDGGLTWTEVDDDPDFECAVVDDDLVVDPSDDRIRYRFTHDEKIERSVDGGATWQDAFLLEPMGQAEVTYYTRTRVDPVAIPPVPLDAIADPASGNTLFAMGHQGVLVYTKDGEWKWVGVGPHIRMDADYAASIPRMLVVELTLALTFAGLSFATLSQRNVWNKPFLVLILITWAVWVFASINFAPGGLVRSVRYDIAEIVCSGLVLLLFGMGILYALVNLVPMVKNQRGSLIRLSLVALIGTAIYFLPYVLWMLDILPSYRNATIIAIAAGAVTLVAGDLWHRSYLKTLRDDGGTSADEAGENDVP